MIKDGWHILREEGVVTMARRLPVRFDLAVETVLPDGNMLRIARQVRQDMWRALQGLRGFQPAVQVTRFEGGLRVRAGGGLPKGAIPSSVTRQLADLLEDPVRRARWIRWAAAQ